MQITDYSSNSMRVMNKLKSLAAVIRQEIKSGNAGGYTRNQMDHWKTKGAKYAAVVGSGKWFETCF